MLFRERVSFRGALNVQRRACGKMSSYNASANAHHASPSSVRRFGSLAFSSPIEHTNEPSSTSIRALSPKDCRWKRRRHVDPSNRAFSTKDLGLTLQLGDTSVTLEGSDAQKQAQSQQEPGSNLAQLRQHSTGVAEMKNATQQNTPAMRLPCAIQHDQLAATRLNHANTNNASMENDRAATALGHSFQATHGAASTIKLSDDFIAGSKSKSSPSGHGTMNNAIDTDLVSCSTDESACQLDKDALEGDESSKKAGEMHASLEFQIPEDTLRAAMTAPENTKASFWSSSLYRGSEGRRIAIHYCKTKEVAERVAQHFVNEKVVGFDIEWKPWAAASSIKKNVSLIQLASEDRIALFHIALFTGTTAAQLMPRTLKAILESPAVYKVGVAVKGDFSRITKFLEVKPQGVFELSRLHNLVEWYAIDSNKVTNKLVGLASQVQRHLQLPLYKGGHLVDDPEDLLNVRSSDWSLPLNVQQIHYAAADAYAGFRLYDVLEEKRKQLRPIPPRPLVCDYDSKPVPRCSTSKKKRKSTIKRDNTAKVVAEDIVALVGQEEGTEEDMGEETELTQETDGYETAQEQLTDSHQLEGEEQESSQESFEETSESENDLTIDSAPSAKDKTKAMRTDVGQKPNRVGRVNASLLKESDPGYPILPDLYGGEGTYASPNYGLIGLNVLQEGDLSDSNNSVQESEDLDSSSDEFEDSELEELLKDLNIDGDGRVHKDMNETISSGPVMTLHHATQVSDSSLGAKHTQIVEESRVEDLQPLKDEQDIDHIDPSNAGPMHPMVNKSAAPTASVSSNKEVEKAFTDLLNDPEVTDYPDTPTRPPAFSPPSSLDKSTESAGTCNHTPEYDLATSWARTYLASTIPSPTLRTPSHIRATIPHLRAYNMWYHQELSLSEIAQHLRDPPLSESTVGNYVLQAITLERMEYDANEVRKILVGMPEALRKGKWKSLVEKVGA